MSRYQKILEDPTFIICNRCRNKKANYPEVVCVECAKEINRINEKAMVEIEKKMEKSAQSARHARESRRFRSQAKRSRYQADSMLTIEQWKTCLKFFNYRCAYCGRKSPTLHQEHFIPLINGGEYTATNILPSCPTCNMSKGAKEFNKWFAKQKVLNKKQRKSLIKKYFSICEASCATKPVKIGIYEDGKN